ncbi:outer membrane protein N [Klebsiella pneumoniae]|uniref:Outer membrane protein N n=1 Tax=Klebsiella pneumoniae TaxID=573 RepID=A0A377VYR8_KLEPN|nr:outer membrane protein N [Klebsiella pneumoniae]
MLPEFGGDTYTQTDVYMTGRTNGVATYRNSDFFGLVDGLHFALQYQGNNENAGSGEGTNNGGKRKLARENGDGFGISSYYDLDMGISFGAAYSSSDRTITSWRPRVAASVMPTAIKPMPGPSARNMTPITSIWPPCMLRPAT